MTEQRPRGAFAGSGALLEPGTWDQIRLTWRLLRDPRVTGLKYLLPALAALYVMSPVDLLPDLIPGLGQVDDLGLVVGMLLLLVRIVPALAPDWVVEEHLARMGKRRAPATVPTAAPSAAPEGPVYDVPYRVLDADGRR